MIKSSLPAALLVALTMTMPFTSQALANESAASPHTRGLVGREVAAPSWSAQCTTYNGPRVCDEPVWVYGSPADVSRYKRAF